MSVCGGGGGHTHLFYFLYDFVFDLQIFKNSFNDHIDIMESLYERE